MKISEYDAFGPWIYKIDEEHEIPRYFRRYVDEDDGAVFRLKVPKNIDRRAANPEMDLYEYLLNIYEDRLELMQIADGGIRLQKVYFKRVCAVSAFRDLLLGRLTIYTEDDVLTFDYNAVSLDLITEVVAAIRKGYQAVVEKKEAKAYDPSQLKLDDLFFVNEWLRLEPEERPFVHCAYQTTHDFSDSKGQLLGSLHMQKEQEWVILRKLEKYSYDYLYLPRKDSLKIKTGGSSENSGTSALTIDAGRFSAEILYDTGNSELEANYK